MSEEEKQQIEHFYKRLLEERNIEKDEQIHRLRTALQNIVAMDASSGASMKILAAMVLASTNQ